MYLKDETPVGHRHTGLLEGNEALHVVLTHNYPPGDLSQRQRAGETNREIHASLHEPPAAEPTPATPRSTTGRVRRVWLIAAVLVGFTLGIWTDRAGAANQPPPYRNVYELQSSITPGTRATLVVKCHGTVATEDALSILRMTRLESGVVAYRCVGTAPRWEAMR